MAIIIKNLQVYFLSFYTSQVGLVEMPSQSVKLNPIKGDRWHYLLYMPLQHHLGAMISVIRNKISGFKLTSDYQNGLPFKLALIVILFYR